MSRKSSARRDDPETWAISEVYRRSRSSSCKSFTDIEAGPSGDYSVSYLKPRLGSPFPIESNSESETDSELRRFNYIEQIDIVRKKLNLIELTDDGETNNYIITKFINMPTKDKSSCVITELDESKLKPSKIPVYRALRKKGKQTELNIKLARNIDKIASELKDKQISSFSYLSNAESHCSVDEYHPPKKRKCLREKTPKVRKCEALPYYIKLGLEAVKTNIEAKDIGVQCSNVDFKKDPDPKAMGDSPGSIQSRSSRCVVFTPVGNGNEPASAEFKISLPSSGDTSSDSDPKKYTLNTIEEQSIDKVQVNVRVIEDDKVMERKNCFQVNANSEVKACRFQDGCEKGDEGRKRSKGDDEEKICCGCFGFKWL